MKIAVASLREHVVSVIATVGLEGWLLLLGTALVAVGSSYVSPAGPWIVVGAVALLLGLALAVPVRRGN